MIQARAIRNEKEIEFFEAGSKITLTEPVKLVLNLNGQTIADYQRVDNDLVITLESNQTVLIGNFFQPETQSALFVEDGEDLVAFSIDLVPVGDSGFEFADASGAVAGSGATAASAATGSTLSLSAVATAVGAGVLAVAGVASASRSSDDAPDQSNDNPPLAVEDPPVEDAPVEDAPVDDNPGSGSENEDQDDDNPDGEDDEEIIDIIEDVESPENTIIDLASATLIFGSAEIGAIISVDTDDDGQTDLTTVADDSGLWAAYPDQELAHETLIGVTATDQNGNESAQVVAFIDAIAPDAPIVQLATADLIEGTGEAGSTIDIDTDGNLDDRPELSTLVDPNGDWSVIPIDVLKPGTTISVFATDAGNNQSAATTATIGGSREKSEQLAEDTPYQYATTESYNSYNATNTNPLDPLNT